MFIGELLGEAQRIVTPLRLQANEHHLCDDIIQMTMIVATRNLPLLRSMEADHRRGWLFGTMFLVMRNTKRAELRRTATWTRLRNALHSTPVRSHFDVEDDTRTDDLLRALSALTELDRQLLVGSVWKGYTARELASEHGLTEKAVHNRISRARLAARQQLIPTQRRGHPNESDREG